MPPSVCNAFDSIQFDSFRSSLEETRWIQPKTPNSSKLKMTAQHKMNRNDCLNSDVCVSLFFSGLIVFVCVCVCAYLRNGCSLSLGHTLRACVCVLFFIMEIFSRFAYYCLPLNIQNVQFKFRALSRRQRQRRRRRRRRWWRSQQIEVSDINGFMAFYPRMLHLMSFVCWKIQTKMIWIKKDKS